MSGFFDIEKYLERFKTITPPENITKKHIIHSIEEKTGILLKNKNIKIQNATVFIKTNPFIKNEIFYRKNEIIDFYNKVSGGKKISLN